MKRIVELGSEMVCQGSLRVSDVRGGSGSLGELRSSDEVKDVEFSFSLFGPATNECWLNPRSSLAAFCSLVLVTIPKSLDNIHTPSISIRPPPSKTLILQLPSTLIFNPSYGSCHDPNMTAQTIPFLLRS